MTLLHNRNLYALVILSFHFVNLQSDVWLCSFVSNEN